MNPLFDDPHRLGEAIRRARRHADMSQDQLAAELGTTRQRLSKWEQGKEPERPRTPEQRRAFAIAVAEMTGAPRDGLGLSEPEPDLVAQLQKEAQDLRAQMTKLISEVAALQRGEAELRSRVRRLEP